MEDERLYQIAAKELEVGRAFSRMPKSAKTFHGRSCCERCVCPGLFSMAQRVSWLVIVTLCVALMGSAVAQVYRWVDKNGKMHYGDIPADLNNAESVRSRSSNTDMSGMREQAERLRERQAPARHAAAKDESVEPKRQPTGAAQPTQAQIDRYAAQMKRYDECMVKARRAIASSSPAANIMVDLCAAMLPRPVAGSAKAGTASQNVEATLAQAQRYEKCMREADRLQGRNPTGAAVHRNVCASMAPSAPSQGPSTPCFSDVACPSGQKCVRTADMASGVCRRVVDSYGVPDYTTRAGGTVVTSCTSDGDCGGGGVCRSLDGNPANMSCIRR